MINDWRAASAALALSAALAGTPSPAATVTAADYARAEALLPYRTAPLVHHALEPPHWLADGTFWYRTTTADGPAFIRIDPRRRRREPLFDAAGMASALSQAAAKPVHAMQLPFESVEVAAGGTAIQFDAFTRHWTCSLPAGPCAAAAAPDVDASTSPDGSRAVFIRDQNLWFRNLATAEERPLTQDGQPDFGYATDNPGWAHSAHAVVAWSPDGKRVATYQQDEREVGELYLVNTQPGHPRLDRWKAALSGDKVIATLQRVIIDVDAGRTVRLQMPPDAHRSSACYDVQCGDYKFADTQWSPDGTRLAFVSTSRDHKVAQLRVADAATGMVRDVLEERSPTFYESDIASTSHAAINWRFLPRLNQVIWYSERSGRAHLYLYDLASGELQHPITRGDWDVVEILRIDEKARQIYFTAVGHERGEDPYYAHLYRVGLDGHGLSLLTPEVANHEITFDATGRYFVDRYSTPQIPPVAVLRDSNGRLIMPLEHAEIGALRAAGWRPPEGITVKARDGVTDLYGLLYRPASFDPQKSYPLITWVYPGPQVGSVGSRSFAASRGDRQSLAELGFIVVAIDGMGTPFRGKKFHDTYFGKMRDNTLPDQVSAIRELGARFPWIALDRVGIYGHSGGGYATAAAMFTYPDFFKVGIAESGNHDQLGYTDDWGDKFGAARDDAQDNYSIAKNLKGRLLLAHGTLDENVPPNLTMRMVDTLIKLNKDFDLIMLPNQHHPYRDDAGLYMTRRRWDYFVQYLLNAQPPHEFSLTRPATAANDED